MSFKPVLIVGPHKSGTSLLRSLFDGHPHLAVVPYESHLASAFGIPIHYPLKRTTTDPPQTAEEVLARLVALLRSYVSGRRRTADSQLDWIPLDAIESRATAISERFSKSSPDPTAESLKLYLESAYWLASGELPGDRRLVEKSVENAELVPLILDRFPGARVVQIARDPVSTVAAIRRTMATRPGRRLRYPYLRPVVNAIEFAHVVMRQNAALFPARVMSIRYEDLTEDPRSVMVGVANFLEIPFDPSLDYPTVLGRAWEGNSSTGERKVGVVSAHRAGGSASRLEEQVVAASVYIGDSAERRANWRRISRCLRPERGESPVVYVLNRLLVGGA